MSKANAKKAPRSSKKAQQKLSKVMRGMNKAKQTPSSSSKAIIATCSRAIYCV
ncbi:MAG: hypothetical protein ABW123_15730 [Cystobacter sp.]